MSITKTPELIRHLRDNYDNLDDCTMQEKLLIEIHDNENEICITENKLGRLKAQNMNLMNKLAHITETR